MPPYSGPSKERGNYSARFIRVQDRLFTSDPDDNSTTHKNLALKDGISDEVQLLKKNDPKEVDAGVYSVINNRIIVTGESLSLSIPLATVGDKTRSKTLALFELVSPHYTIIPGT